MVSIQKFGQKRPDSIVDAAVQVNNGLEEAAACGSTVVYDQKYGLVFLVYMTGTRTSYGESTGRICVSVFPPAQPTNVRFRHIDDGVGGSRGVLCGCAYLVGDAKIRIVFTTTKGRIAAWYRDYDFLNDTVSERTEVFLRAEGKDVPCDTEQYAKLLALHGCTGTTDAPCIINRPCAYQGKVYTALTVDGVYYPIICRIEENVLVPVAFCPVQGCYEFRCYLDESGIHGVFRDPVDDQGTAKSGYAFSPDGGKTWEKQVFADGIQSRPDILPYYGKPLIIYNYLDERPVDNFPPMHNHRNAIRMLHDGKEVFTCFEKYGIVEHFTVSIYGDLYMAFSTCEQALSVASGTAWIEQGRPVEQGKEEIKWVRLGYCPD